MITSNNTVDTTVVRDQLFIYTGMELKAVLSRTVDLRYDCNHVTSRTVLFQKTEFMSHLIKFAAMSTRRIMDTA